MRINLVEQKLKKIIKQTIKENFDPTFSDVGRIWDLLVECQIATDDEIRLVCQINGTSMETLNKIIYVRTGYHDWEQFEHEELRDGQEDY